MKCTFFVRDGLVVSPAAMRLGAKRVLWPLLCAGLCLGSSASAGDFDLEEDAPAKTLPASAPVIVVKAHTYTLAECLALADRNHPNLWAARARLAFVHAQLDEAKWAPFFSGWNADSTFAIGPPLVGTAVYGAIPLSAHNLTLGQSLSPYFKFNLNGTLPVYTFGKIDAVKSAAEANVRVNEWDLEKWRQLTRMDVRRAYFGLMLARDAKYIVDDIVSQLDKGIRGVKEKLDKSDPAVEDVDRFRLEVYKDEILARAGETQRGEMFASAALRFMTGVQSNFDIPDVPLKTPDTPLGPVAHYLGAARLFRPEVNMARAGVAARRAQVNLARANYFPSFGLGVGASYAVAPSAVIQPGWSSDGLNYFFWSIGAGLKWSLDFLPNSARVAQAESQLEETRSYERLALGGTAVEVENAYGIALEARNREEAWARAEHLGKKWMATVLDAIDLGTKDERALLEPLRVYLNARIQHETALMDANVSMSDLARVSGWDSAAPTGK